MYERFNESRARPRANVPGNQNIMDYMAGYGMALCGCEKCAEALCVLTLAKFGDDEETQKICSEIREAAAKRRLERGGA